MQRCLCNPATQCCLVHAQRIPSRLAESLNEASLPLASSSGVSAQPLQACSTFTLNMKRGYPARFHYLFNDLSVWHNKHQSRVGCLLVVTCMRFTVIFCWNSWSYVEFPLFSMTWSLKDWMESLDRSPILQCLFLGLGKRAFPLPFSSVTLHRLGQTGGLVSILLFSLNHKTCLFGLTSCAT